jgi:hypothetical protein
MDFQIRLSNGDTDTFRAKNDPKRYGEYYEYWFEGEVTTDKALAVHEVLQRWAWVDAVHRPQKPERRRRVAYYRPDEWVSYREVSDGE